MLARYKRTGFMIRMSTCRYDEELSLFCRLCPPSSFTCSLCPPFSFTRYLYPPSCRSDNSDE